MLSERERGMRSAPGARRAGRQQGLRTLQLGSLQCRPMSRNSSDCMFGGREWRCGVRGRRERMGSGGRADGSSREAHKSLERALELTERKEGVASEGDQAKPLFASVRRFGPRQLTRSGSLTVMTRLRGCQHGHSNSSGLDRANTVPFDLLISPSTDENGESERSALAGFLTDQ